MLSDERSAEQPLRMRRHSTTAIILGTYSHVIPGMGEAAGAMDEPSATARLQ
jgi:hypothetical protein